MAKDFKALRDEDGGKLPSYTSLGSYPLFYLTADYAVLCPKCANEEASENHEEKQWKLVEFDVHWEGAPLGCEHCGALIESAYGDDEGVQ